jgi:hypothetical protein
VGSGGAGSSVTSVVIRWRQRWGGREADLAAMQWPRAPVRAGGGERSEVRTPATEDRRKYLIYPEECLLPLDDTSTYDDI